MMSRISRCVLASSRLSNTGNRKIATFVASGAFTKSTAVVNFRVSNRSLSQTSDIDKINKDFFHICGNGDVELAKRMLNGGWSVNDRDKTDATALMWAAAAGHLPMVKFLVEEDANLDAKNNVGSTALWHAIWKGHKDVAIYLKEAGADINITDIDGNSLLHLAADEGKIEYVRLLLEWGVDMHIINWDGFLAKDLAQDKQVRELLNKDIDFTYY